MYVEYLYWKDHIMEKILYRHGVTPEEVEEVIFDGSPIFLRSRKSKKRKKRYVCLGLTNSGRHLKIVLEHYSGGEYIPLTAYNMPKKDKRYFIKKRK